MSRNQGAVVDAERFGETEGPGFRARFRALTEMVERTLRTVGLYLDTATMYPAPGEDQMNPAKVLLHVDVLVGDIAWAPRTINPAQAQVDDQFRQMTRDAEDAEIERIRRQWEDRS